MKSKLIIVGLTYEFECLEVGRTKVFPGAGHLVATAIRRTSKNRYQVYVILEYHADNIDKKSIGEAVEYLQRMYDKYGKLPHVGDFKAGENDEERENDVT